MYLHSFRKFAIALSAICMPLSLMADSNQQPEPTPAPQQDDAIKAPTKEELFSPKYIERLSQTYGHLIQKSLDNPVIKLNAQAVIQGMQDAMVGKPSPLSEQEYEQALTLIQKYAYEDMANKNLAEAEEYLKNNAKEAGVVSLDDGKVQYIIVQEGTGEAVTDDTMPSINYSASFANGQKLGSSEQTGGPIDVKLNETIKGFREGMLGMKVGEKRRLFIHPDVGYGKSGQQPNGLLIFEIEVTKLVPKPADSPDDEHDNDSEDDLSNLVDSDEMMADDDDDDDDDDMPGTLEVDEEELDIDEEDDSAT